MLHRAAELTLVLPYRLGGQNPDFDEDFAERLEPQLLLVNQ